MRLLALQLAYESLSVTPFKVHCGFRLECDISMNLNRHPLRLLACAWFTLLAGCTGMPATLSKTDTKADAKAQIPTNAPTTMARGAEPQCPPLPTQPSNESLQALMQSAKDRGFLWSIEKDGVKSYLFGTIHVNKLDWMFLGPKTMQAAASSNIVAMELDPLDPAIQQGMSDLSKAGIERYELAPLLAARMKAAAQKVCVPDAVLDQSHPVMQLVLLGLFDARFEGLEASYGVELFLSGFSRQVKKEIVSLESMGGTQNEQIEGIEQNLKLIEAGEGRRKIARMANAWGASNLDDFENISQWCNCMNTERERAEFRKLNDERNPGMAESIDKLHKQGKSIFAAVGSLHMTGAKSLPKLMTQKGYKVERVAF
jgi:uncharacterized protein